MTTPVRGGCLCGHVRYEIDGTVGPASYCHCEDCRRCTGSAFNVGVRVEKAALRMVAGAPKGFTKRADSGNELTRHFCPECGSPIFTSAPRHPEHVFVKAGTFDDPTVVAPVREAWTASSVAWGRIAPGLASFPRGAQ